MPPECMFGTYKPGPTTVWQIGVVLYETLHQGEKFETTGFLQNKFPIKKGLSRSKKFTATRKTHSALFYADSYHDLCLP